MDKEKYLNYIALINSYNNQFKIVNKDFITADYIIYGERKMFLIMEKMSDKFINERTPVLMRFLTKVISELISNIQKKYKITENRVAQTDNKINVNITLEPIQTIEYIALDFSVEKTSRRKKGKKINKNFFKFKYELPEGLQL